MHYYQFNIADYRKDTQHLTPMEHYIHRTLLDWLYLDESPLPKDTRKLLRYLRLDNGRLTDVEQVLNDFWTEIEDGWIQSRALQEIEAYKGKQEAASRAGKASAEARRVKRSKGSQRTLNKRTATEQPTNNHKPLTNDKKIVDKKRKRFSPPALTEVTDYITANGYSVDPNRFIAHYESNGWKVGKNPMKDWKAAIRGWHTRGTSDASTEQRNPNSRPLSAVDRVRQATGQH